MDDVQYREMRPEDAEAALALRNSVFAHAPLSMERWVRSGRQAAIAVRQGAVVGAIPLASRDLVLAPSRTLRASFEFAVGTREDLRSRGIGSGMVGAARAFLRDRADGLFVYRGAERSDGYRFYVKSGHHDLLYTRAYHLPESVPAGEVEAVAVDAERIAAEEERLLPPFMNTYGRFAGYPERGPGAWRRALTSPVFTRPGTAVFLLPLHDGDLLAYALVAVREGGPVQALELATRDGGVATARRLLAAVAAFAARRGREVLVQLADDDPFVPVLQATGWRADPRGLVVMGQLLDVPAFFARHWAAAFRLEGAGLRVWTPAQDHVLVPPAPGAPTLSLEMKEETLHRWLLGRIDLATRLREGTVSAYGADGRVQEAVAAAIPVRPWAYHALDWI
jgi:GNAT superfamily N-acetyltransferase